MYKIFYIDSDPTVPFHGVAKRTANWRTRAFSLLGLEAKPATSKTKHGWEQVRIVGKWG